ncbi:MAG: nucleoside monophosphate kinase [Parcubacteria group bacterium]|nr:nucleoside monophosphate kinase [Parcubacteria group bacterium]
MIPFKKGIVIAFLGRSGSGKGTQANLLAKKFNLRIISTGNLARDFSKEKSMSGKLIAQILEKGGFLPHWLASFLWMREIIQSQEPFLRIAFEGSPRKSGEARDIDEVFNFYGLKNNIIAFYINISRQEAIKRLLARGREDDTKKAIENRLDEFEKFVIPVIEYYKKTKRLITINGQQSVEDVFKEIVKKLKVKNDCSIRKRN